ncbi:MAG: polysaccharide biosynthesis C-terminal domain-containing protein [Fuerstiella sp.]
MPSESQNGTQEVSKDRQGLRKFLRFSLIYAVGDVLTKGARILLIPFYLAYLSKSEVGQVAVIQAVIILSSTLMGLGFGFVVRRFYHDYAEQGDAFASTLWGARLFAALPVYGMLLVAGTLLHGQSAGAVPLHIIQLAITVGFIRGGQNITELWLNVREEPVAYRAFTFTQFFLTTALAIYLVGFRGLGVIGVVVGELLSQIIMFLVSAFLHLRKSLPQRRVVKWKAVFAYSVPVLPHAFFMWGLLGIDRLILNEHVSSSKIAVYEIGYVLASFLSIVIGSMRAAWTPDYFRNAENDANGNRYAQVTYLYMLLTTSAALLGLLFAPEIIALFSLTSKVAYDDSVHVMRIVVFGYVAMAIFLASNQFLLYHHKTGLLSFISGAGFTINVVANTLLIPQIGIWGAGIATVLAYTSMSIATIYFTAPNPWTARTNFSLLLTLGSFVIFGIAACLLPSHWDAASLVARVAIILSFLLVTLVRIKRNEKGARQIQFRFGTSDFRTVNHKGTA